MANKALRYVGKRILRWLFMLWVIISVTFLLFRVAPGDPTSFLVGGFFTEETKQQIMANFGLTKPLHIQYFLFIKNLLLEGEFGMSFRTRSPVFALIGPRLINSLLLTGPAMVLTMIFAYFFGTYLGWNRGTKIEQAGSYILLGLRSLPNFVFGMLLIMIFTYWLGIIPSGGMGPVTQGEKPLSELLTSITFYQYWFLPFMTLLLTFLADPFLLMRGNIIDERQTDYIELLRLKGLTDRTMRTHAARNALLPLVTWSTAQVAIAFGASVLIEIVFSWPGIGRTLVLAVHRNDYPVAQAAFFVIAFAIVTTNLIVDLLYVYIDPRVTNE